MCSYLNKYNTSRHMYIYTHVICDVQYIYIHIYMIEHIYIYMDIFYRRYRHNI